MIHLRDAAESSALCSSDLMKAIISPFFLDVFNKSRHIHSSSVSSVIRQTEFEGLSDVFFPVANLLKKAKQEKRGNDRNF